MARRLMPLVAAAAVTVLMAGSAGAGTTGQEHYSGTDEFTDTSCGFTLNGVSTFSGSVLFRETKGGEAFLVKDSYTFRDVLTNPDTGQWFVISGRATVKEISATHVDGNVYEFEVIEAGQPFVLSDSDGNVIVRDRGAIRHTVVFDTLGDGEPGGEFVDYLGADVHGPHPGFAEDFPFCAIAADLTGAND